MEIDLRLKFIRKQILKTQYQENKYYSPTNFLYQAKTNKAIKQKMEASA